MESVGKTGSVSNDKTNTIPPGTKVRNAVEPLRRTGLWSVERSTWMPREGTCPEYGRCAGLTATLGIEPVAESRWTNESGDMAINEQREFSCQ